MTLQRVTASPIVAQGGECMSSFYDTEGVMVLACSGHLRFAAATSQAIRNMIEYFKESPGFYDGDQFFFNDPYVAGSHTYDMMVIKPIFYDGELIAWTATSTHTADTGGVLRGGALEIFHEGICISGLKIVEKGEFREDVFRTLVGMCRDPQYVGLDMKAMIAGNNVCADRYLGLVDKFGPEFVEAAGRRMIEDSEAKARAKLRSLPDGTWVSREYVTTLDRKSRKAVAQQLYCTMTKKGEELEFDLEGTSPQTDTDHNSTFPSTAAHITLALTNALFWDVPWSDGKMKPVTLKIPEGTILNCTFPAACGAAPRVGNVLVSTICECVSKMLYAAGREEDVNASTTGNLAYAGGPGYFYGGHTRDGIRVAQGLYDIHGAGMGGAPLRDGVNTGGHMNIPSAGISDIERIEMQYPFLYFTRGHNPDGSGFGSTAAASAATASTGSTAPRTAAWTTSPTAAWPRAATACAAAIPPARACCATWWTPAWSCWTGSSRASTRTAPACATAPGARWSIPTAFPSAWRCRRAACSSTTWPGAAGFGDPLERDPALVLRDFGRGWLTAKIGEEVYGVVLARDGRSVDEAATRSLRERVRAERKQLGRPRPARPRRWTRRRRASTNRCCASTPAWRSPAATARTPSAAPSAATSTAAPRRTTRTTRCAASWT